MTHTDPTDAHETELRDLLQRGMADTRPPSELAARALGRGRRLRARRRLGVAAGAVAAGAAAAIVLPFALGGASTTVVDPAGAPGPAAAEPTEAQPVPARPPGWWDMPATDMVAAVAAILPDAVTVTEPGPLVADSEEGGPAVGSINPVLTGPAGPGRLNVILYPDPPADQPADEAGCGPTGASPGLPCAGLPARGEADLTAVGEGQLVDSQLEIGCAAEIRGRTTCTEIEEDGTVIGRRLVVRWGQGVAHEVVLRREGGTVYASAVNTLDEKWDNTSPSSADQPPLTLAQVEDLVRNDTWVHPAT